MSKTKTKVVPLKPGKLPRRLEMKLKKMANDLSMLCGFAASIESSWLHPETSYAKQIQELQKRLEDALRYAKTL